MAANNRIITETLDNEEEFMKQAKDAFDAIDIDTHTEESAEEFGEKSGTLDRAVVAEAINLFMNCFLFMSETE